MSFHNARRFVMNSKLADEAGRLASLRRYDVLDTPPEAPFDKVTQLVKTVLNVPISAVALIDADRQWFKSCVGLDARQTARDISFCTQTIQSCEPLVVNDAARDPRFAQNPFVTGAPFIASYAGAPLTTPDGYNIGSLCAIDTVPRQFDNRQIDVLTSFAAIVVDEFELRRLAQIDSLTGAVSRRAFLAEAERAVADFTRHHQPSAIVMFDVDHFKRINDTHGHPAGDTVLSAIGACLAAHTRPGDIFARLGGEEFALLLSGADIGQAVQAAERCRAALENLTIGHHPPISITASFGIAALNPDCMAADKWLGNADLALYAAKRTGRNKCCVHEEALLDSAG
jgi:diguanylate cyclase (GGDEF)-like protein